MSSARTGTEVVGERDSSYIVGTGSVGSEAVLVRVSVGSGVGGTIPHGAPDLISHPARQRQVIN